MAENADVLHLTLEERVEAIVQEVIANTSLLLIEVSVRGQKGSRVVDIYIDNDTVLDVTSLAGVSREVGFLLETEEVIDGKYILNVSSPGVDRPLRLPVQYKKNIGRPLSIRFLPDSNETKKRIQGILEECDETGLVLKLPSGKNRSIRYDEIQEAKVKLPW